MSSTSIVIKCLSDTKSTNTPHGAITIGTLILQVILFHSAAGCAGQAPAPLRQHLLAKDDVGNSLLSSEHLWACAACDAFGLSTCMPCLRRMCSDHVHLRSVLKFFCA